MPLRSLSTPLLKLARRRGLSFRPLNRHRFPHLAKPLRAVGAMFDVVVECRGTDTEEEGESNARYCLKEMSVESRVGAIYDEEDASVTLNMNFSRSGLMEAEGRGSKWKIEWIWYGSARNWNCDHGSDATDEYLKEVRGDLAKDEEYFGRAILASPADGDILSLYADII
ncbi:unnamed protein product [Rhodiola kirilowii]